jgi:hypothetical protein
LCDSATALYIRDYIRELFTIVAATVGEIKIVAVKSFSAAACSEDVLDGC